MPSRRNNRFPVAEFMNAKKAQNALLAAEKSVLKKEIRGKQQKVRRLKSKLSRTSSKSEALLQEVNKLPKEVNLRYPIRTPTPPNNQQNNAASRSTLSRRREETFVAALSINGGTLLNKRPAFNGLFDTLSKKCKLDDLGNYVLSNDKLTSYVIEQKQKKDRLAFEASEANNLRSIATYYTAGVMGKRKYQAVRLSSTMKFVNAKRTAITFMSKCPIPKLLTYNKLAAKLKEINIGKVYSVEEMFDDYIEGEWLF
ncbi:uncharacterized protein LOC114537163 [Dendronephthya gigantea]|uniref:uncharacterized protein LOC114537163 n=1 Tax=Dendronephthya gigantea TaxID=151771 RepID=UPI00106BFFE4|nr:uncharacterized protein LOC114537163 [Dendronephthya gigantea]